jgi:hypothetical protein
VAFLNRVTNGGKGGVQGAPCWDLWSCLCSKPAPESGGVEAKLFFCLLFFGLRMVPGAVTAASEGTLLFDQYRPFAILKPKN